MSRPCRVGWVARRLPVHPDGGDPPRDDHLTGRSPKRCAPDVVLVRTNAARRDDDRRRRRRTRSSRASRSATSWRSPRNRRVPAASVGCALSRARTGMGADEMTCACRGLASKRSSPPSNGGLGRHDRRPLRGDRRRAVRDWLVSETGAPLGPQRRLAPLPAPQGDDSRQLGTRRSSARALGQSQRPADARAGTGST